MSAEDGRNEHERSDRKCRDAPPPVPPEVTRHGNPHMPVKRSESTSPADRGRGATRVLAPNVGALVQRNGNVTRSPLPVSTQRLPRPAQISYYLTSPVHRGDFPARPKSRRDTEGMKHRTARSPHDCYGAIARALAAAAVLALPATTYALPDAPAVETPAIEKVETTFESVDATVSAQWEFPAHTPAPLVVLIPASEAVDRDGLPPGYGEDP